jgi:hypothetical protein
MYDMMRASPAWRVVYSKRGRIPAKGE